MYLMALKVCEKSKKFNTNHANANIRFTQTIKI